MMQLVCKCVKCQYVVCMGCVIWLVISIDSRHSARCTECDLWQGWKKTTRSLTVDWTNACRCFPSHLLAGSSGSIARLSLVWHSLYGGVLLRRVSVSENGFVKFRSRTYHCRTFTKDLGCVVWLLPDVWVFPSHLFMAAFIVNYSNSQSAMKSYFAVSG